MYENVASAEIDGKTIGGDELEAALADLTDEERASVFVTLKSGLRVPLAKLESSTGDDAVRIDPGGKVFF